MAFRACGLCKGLKEEEAADVEIVIQVHERLYKYLVYKMTCHYISNHGYVPCPDFVDAILHGEIVEIIKVRTNGTELPSEYVPWYENHDYSPIGYLVGEYNVGEVDQEVLSKLNELMVNAEGASKEE